MKLFLCPFCLLIVAVSVTGQGPYQLNWKTDGVLMGSATVLAGLTFATSSKVQALTVEEINLLKPQDINRFDRCATNHSSSAANTRSDYGEIAPIIISAMSPFVLPAISENNVSYAKEALTLLLIWGETNLISAAGTHLIKNLTKRARPFVYNPEIGLDSKQSVNARKSFISGHTTASAANSFFLAKVFSDYFPESKLKPYLWGVAVAIPAWTGVERYLAGKHFPTDIIAGYAFGALCGFFIPHMHKADRPNKEVSLAFYPYSSHGRNGLQMVLKF